MNLSAVAEPEWNSRHGIVVLGSLNMDVVLPVSQIPRPGETVLGGAIIRTPGGKGANQAVAAARLGGRVRLIGRLGDDDVGHVIQAELGAAGIDLRSVKSVNGFGSGLAFVAVDAAGENAIIVSPGANTELSPAALQAEGAALRGAKIGVAQLETPLETVEEFSIMCEADGLDLVLNAAPYRELPPSLLRRCGYLVLNRDEASSLSRVDIHTRTDALEALAAVAGLGVRTVIITLGGEGCVALSPTGYLELAAYQVPVVDTTGAGDAFVGALATALDRGDSLDEALRFAAAAGAVACSHVGAQQNGSALREVEALLAQQPQSAQPPSMAELS